MHGPRYVYMQQVSLFLPVRLVILDSLVSASDLTSYHTYKHAAMYRESARHHACHGRRHVEPQSKARTHQTLADVLFTSDQSIYTRRRGDHRL